MSKTMKKRTCGATYRTTCGLPEFHAGAHAEPNPTAKQEADEALADRLEYSKGQARDADSLNRLCSGFMADAKKARAELAKAREKAEALAKALERHFIDKNGHLKSCGGACDPDCVDVRAALRDWRGGGA